MSHTFYLIFYFIFCKASGNRSWSRSMGYVMWKTPRGQPFLKLSRWDQQFESLEMSSVMSMFSVMKVSSDSDS